MYLFERTATLPKRVLEDVAFFCETRACSYADIVNADRGDIWQMGKVNALIVLLRRRGHSVSATAKACNVDPEYVVSVVKHADKHETPLKTFVYGG
jgi:hypothetical protein